MNWQTDFDAAASAASLALFFHSWGAALGIQLNIPLPRYVKGEIFVNIPMARLGLGPQGISGLIVH